MNEKFESVVTHTVPHQPHFRMVVEVEFKIHTALDLKRNENVSDEWYTENSKLQQW